MQTNSSISNVFSRILVERGLSASALSTMLGHRSKTTLNRILQGKAGERSVRQVCGELLDCSSLSLSVREVEMLTRLMSRGCAEIDPGSLFDALEATLAVVPPVCAPVQYVGLSLEAILAGFGEDSFDALLINGCVGQVVDALVKAGARGAVTHYLCRNEQPESALETMRAVFALARLPRYSVSRFSCRPALPGHGVQVLALRCGEVEYELLFPQPTVAIVTAGRGLYSKWNHYVQSFLCHAPGEGDDGRLREDVLWQLCPAPTVSCCGEHATGRVLMSEAGLRRFVMDGQPADRPGGEPMPVDARAALLRRWLAASRDGRFLLLDDAMGQKVEDWPVSVSCLTGDTVIFRFPAARGTLTFSECSRPLARLCAEYCADELAGRHAKSAEETAAVLTRALGWVEL